METTQAQGEFRCDFCDEAYEEAQRSALTTLDGAPICGGCEVDLFLTRLEGREEQQVVQRFLTPENAAQACDESPVTGYLGTVAEDGVTVTFVR
ncbi:hypothetical protein [Myxococcus phage Mx4 ts27htf-1hrm-1]|nr:hypothetical protein Mx4_p96 [Myxococcus phage Mx4]WNM70434.1 hypothetical protein [Myxococcus phage Mx4 ts27htf-1hrm-1]